MMKAATANGETGRNDMARTDQARETTPSDPSALSRDAFAALVMDYYRERNPSRTLVHDPDAFWVTDASTGMRMSLANGYADYRHADETHRQDVLAQYTEIFAKPPELPASFTDAKAGIYPVVCNRWAAESARLTHHKVDADRRLYRKLTDNLAVCVVYDLPSAFIYLQQDTLKRWDVGEDTLYATAVGNMRKLLENRVRRGQTVPVGEFAARQGLTASQLLETVHPAGKSLLPLPEPDLSRSFISKLTFEDLGFGLVAGHPGVFAATEDDWLCSSRVLVEDWIRMLPVKGEPVAMVTHRGAILVTGTEDTASLVGMARLAKSVQGRGHGVSNIPIRLTTDGWQTYQPPRNHPAWAPFASLRTDEMVAVYAAQQPLLQPRHRLDGFVATCLPLPEGTGRTGTVTTWTEGAEPFLPKADWVAFLSFDEAHKTASIVVPPVSWDAVQSIMGHRLDPTDDWPPRYRARGFPSKDEVARLLKAAERAGHPMT